MVINQSMYNIYYIENLINGKFYIGQTSTTIEKRLTQHKRKNSHCLILRQAIEKYGIDNFSINIITVCDNQEQADQEEIFWIEELKKYCILYNIKSGGSYGKHSEETKKKISLSNLGNKNAAGMKPNQTSFKPGKDAPPNGFKSGHKAWNEGTKGVMKSWNKGLTYTKFTSDQINEMKQMRSNGLPNVEIAKHFNCTHATIAKLIGKITKFTETQINLMSKMFDDGLSFNQIALQFKCCHKTAKKLIMKGGIICR